jgi:hypothetical protein
MATLGCPVTDCSAITTRYGVLAARGGMAHTGVDYKARTGTAVKAPAAGVVRRVWWDVGGGRMLAITHSDRLETRYAHLSAVSVKAGQVIAAGQVVAFSGSTGAYVTGPHLHFETWVDGRHTDPVPLVGAAVAAGKPAAAFQPSSNQTAFYRAPGETCPSGYNPGTVNPRLGGAIPFQPFFGRPSNPDGTVNACIRADLGPGENVFTAELGDVAADAVKWLTGPVLAVAANIGILVAAGLIGWGGIRRILDG